jgi:uncharacterized protein with HEPN domain
VPFRNARTHLEDILQSTEHIDEFLLGIDFEGYKEDRKTRSAVERELQIITEAAIRLGDEAEALCPGPDWKGFRGMGNILRHVYHRVDDQIVWNTVKGGVATDANSGCDGSWVNLGGRTAPIRSNIRVGRQCLGD